MFVLLLCAVYCGCAVLTSGFQGSGAKGYFGFVKKQCTVPFVLGLVLVVTALIGAAIGWEVFRAGSYRDLLTVETGDFAADVKEISYDQIPMLDRDSAEKLGNRKLGELADMVSQFEVAGGLHPDQLQGPPGAGDAPALRRLDQVAEQPLRRPARLSHHRHGHPERGGGAPGRRASAIPPPSTSAATSSRYLRFHYPTYMFDTPAFEIDEEGNPYWVCPRIEKTIGLFGGTDIAGAVLVNAVTGEMHLLRRGGRARLGGPCVPGGAHHAAV